MERGALAVAAEVVGVPVEAVEVEVAADLAVFSDPVLAVVVDLVPPRVRAVLLPELDGVGEVLLVVVVVVVLDLVGAVVIPRRPRESFRRTPCWFKACAVSECRARSARRVGLSNRSETSVALSTHCKSQSHSVFWRRARSYEVSCRQDRPRTMLCEC